MKTDNERRIHIGAMIIALIIPLTVGIASAFLTSGDMKIYETVNRPPLAPPGWVFPIVWTLLYIVMGLASYLVHTSSADTEQRLKALLFYAAQLIMNFFWPMFFFSYGLYIFSLIWLLAMWVLIWLCTVRFFRIRRGAGIMMGVLFLWTTFAAYLNLMYCIIGYTPMPV